MCCHLLWKQWRSLLGCCLGCPFAPVGKASALTCGSFIPKMCETTLSKAHKMQAHIWRHLRWCWSASSRDYFPSCCFWMTGGRSPPPLRAGRVMKDINKWKVLLQGLAGNLPLEACESSLLTKCSTSQGEVSRTGGCWGTLYLEIMRRTRARLESWKVTDKNN